MLTLALQCTQKMSAAQKCAHRILGDVGMQYHAYEIAKACLDPLRFGAQSLRHQLAQPYNPFNFTPMAKTMSAACEVFENVTRRYGKPEFGIAETTIDGRSVPITEEIVLAKPFGSLLHFKREGAAVKRNEPKVLLVAPMSGHYATLLRGTVKAMVPEHEVYITDWADAREVPLVAGRFDLDDFIDYLVSFIHFLGPNTHVVAVCQPSVPALAATALMASRRDPLAPASLTLMGGPIDTRRNPTVVNKLAQGRPIEWFERNVISHVPFPNPGCFRKVYPGFVQLTGFMTMNLDRHMTAHMDLYKNLIKGDRDSVQSHQKFYDEYLSVMDLTAEFYLQTVETAFQRHALPDGVMMHRGDKVDCTAIKRTALMTVEGEKDDICGLGQTSAAQDLCVNIPANRRQHYVQMGVGHFGVFNGSRWRTEIQPRIAKFIRAVEPVKV
jgi:poly(3-hydroxybutyrate) depolymerase